MKFLFMLSLFTNALLGTLYYNEHKQVTALEAYRTQATEVLTRAGKAVDKAIDIVDQAAHK